MIKWRGTMGAGTLLVVLTVAGGCAPRPGEPLQRQGDEIVAAGHLFHTGTPVVLWFDPDGYDAYRARRHFEPSETMPSSPAAPGNPNRYGTRNVPGDLQERIDREGWTLENLQDAVDQFVIHYDACGTSRQCFKILQDVRGLSVQFMLDVDGTIYQTLDLKERAWHAGTANDRSVGIEIANIGAYPDLKPTLEQWYVKDESCWPVVTFPDWMEETGIRTPGFVARPARCHPIEGTINGNYRIQYDYTNEQYEALIKLTATLVRVFPKLELKVPRNGNGEVRTDAFSREELAAYSGILGHQNVTSGKSDPGPAFDWERLLAGTRHELGWWWIQF